MASPIRPDDLPETTTVNPNSAIIVDDGVTVRKATPIKVVDAAIPLASQLDAEAGLDNEKRMSSLRVKQAIDAQAATIEAVNARVPYTELASTAPVAGAGLVGALSPYAGAVVRTLEDPVRESRSVLEWFTNTERSAARAGNLSLDMTAAIQAAVSSGAPVIDMHDYAYRIDGQVNLPVAGVRLLGNGWTAQRGAGIVNNSDKMFYAVGATGAIYIENGSITGNVDRLGPGYSANAAGMYFDECVGGVTLRYMNSTGFAVGAYVRYVDGLDVTGGDYTGNILTGISGLVNNYTIDGARLHANGYETTGLTHDLYLINSSHGVVRNNYFGDHLDPDSESVVIRQGTGLEVPGFIECEDVDFYGNTLSANGMLLSSDPNPAGSLRRPPRNVRIHHNNFGDTELRIEDPVLCASWNNTRIGKLTVRMGSTFPGFADERSFTSDGDEANQVQNAVVQTLWTLGPEKKIKFRRTTASGEPPFVQETTFGTGARPDCLIEDPTIKSTGPVFDSGSVGKFLERYRAGYVIVKSLQGDLAKLHNTEVAFTTVANGEVYDFETAVTTASKDPHQLLLTGNTASVGPMIGRQGQVAEFFLRAHGVVGRAVLTLPANVALSTATANALATGGLSGNRLSFTLRCENTIWLETVASAGWI